MASAPMHVSLRQLPCCHTLLQQHLQLPFLLLQLSLRLLPTLNRLRKLPLSPLSLLLSLSSLLSLSLRLLPTLNRLLLPLSLLLLRLPLPPLSLLLLGLQLLRLLLLLPALNLLLPQQLLGLRLSLLLQCSLCCSNWAQLLLRHGCSDSFAGHAAISTCLVLQQRLGSRRLSCSCKSWQQLAGLMLPQPVLCRRLRLLLRMLLWLAGPLPSRGWLTTALRRRSLGSRPLLLLLLPPLLGRLWLGLDSVQLPIVGALSSGLAG